MPEMQSAVTRCRPVIRVILAYHFLLCRLPVHFENLFFVELNNYYCQMQKKILANFHENSIILEEIAFKIGQNLFVQGYNHTYVLGVSRCNKLHTKNVASVHYCA